MENRKEPKYQEIFEIVLRWKFFWQKQEDYFDRAFGVDANMMHHLTELIVERLEKKKNEIS